MVWDRVSIIFLKEPYNNILIMSTFLSLTLPEGQKEKRSIVNGKVFKFKYPEVVTYHYRYRGAVENHNALSHDGGT